MGYFLHKFSCISYSTNINQYEKLRLFMTGACNFFHFLNNRLSIRSMLFCLQKYGVHVYERWQVNHRSIYSLKV